MHINFNILDSAVIYGFVLFNACLCVLVGLGIPLNSISVVLIQAALTAYVLMRVVHNGEFERIEMMFIVVITIFMICTFLLKESANPKMIFDAYSVILFLIFGKITKANVPNIVSNITILVLLVSFVEIIFPSLYLNVFPIGKYYFLTRSWVANQDLDVTTLTYYIGAVRPGDSYFSFIDHRLGSLFLESLSLGYFLSLAYFVWALRVKEYSRRAGFFILAGIVLACILTDMRTAILMFFIAVIFYVFKKPLVRISPAIYSISIVVVFFAVMHISDKQGELYYRLSLTFLGLSEITLLELAGLDTMSGNFNDSGYLYLISIYGILPVLFFYLLMHYYFKSALTLHSRYIILITTIFFTIAMFFGFAFMSAKISALWFGLLGYLYSEGRRVKC